MSIRIAWLPLLCTMSLVACGADTSPDRESVSKAPASQKDFDPGRFSGSVIDNRLYPLRAGTQFVYRGRADRGGGPLSHRVIFTVTDLTKTVDGVQTVVMWDRDINGGKLVEAEITFFAQDDDGNVWNLGEYPEEYDERGRFDGAPSTWLSGRANAKAGILMRAEPAPGTSKYVQGTAPDIGFGDEARVTSVGGERDCVPAGCYDDVAVIEETNPLEPGDGYQLKYYAPGVGNFRVAPGRGGTEREVLELVKVRTLGAKELARMRSDALRLDRRAYRTKPEIWKGTAPAVRSPR